MTVLYRQTGQLHLFSSCLKPTFASIDLLVLLGTCILLLSPALASTVPPTPIIKNFSSPEVGINTATRWPYSEPIMNTTATTPPPNHCSTSIPSTNLLLTMNFNQYYPIPQRPLSSSTLAAFLDFIDVSISVEANNAGGQNRQVPADWRQTWRWSSYAMRLYSESGRLWRSRVKYIELREMLVAIWKCEEEIGWRQVVFELWRGRSLIVRGYLTA